MTHLATADSDLGSRASSSSASARRRRRSPDADAARREQRGGAAAARVALRRGPLRDRALRALAVRHRRRRRRARARALLDERARARQLLRRASRPATGAGSSPARHLDRDRPGRLRRRLPPRPDGNRGAGRRRAPPRRRRGLDGRDRCRARPRAARGTPVTIVGPGVPLEEHARSRARSPTSLRRDRLDRLAPGGSWSTRRDEHTQRRRALPMADRHLLEHVVLLQDVPHDRVAARRPKRGDDEQSPGASNLS